MNFYGIAVWRRYNVTSIRRFESACIKRSLQNVLWLQKQSSCPFSFSDLKLLTMSTLLHNAVYKVHDSVFKYWSIFLSYIMMNHE